MLGEETGTGLLCELTVKGAWAGEVPKRFTFGATDDELVVLRCRF